MSTDKEDEADLSLKRVDSGKLTRHLYNRHKLQFWAYFNLIMSTLNMVMIGRSVHSPTLWNVIYGVAASELGHVFLVLQAFNLKRIYGYHPAIFAGWVGRAALVANAWAYSAVLYNLWRALGMRSEFSRSLQKQNIAPRAGSSTGRLYYILSLIPLFLISRRGKSLNVQRNLRYADFDKVDPGLINQWRRTPPTLRNLHMIALRGRISNWLSLDVIKVDPMPNPGEKKPILMYIHGGGWTILDKSISALSFVQRVASRGVIVVTVNYRMAPNVVWPTQIIDCKRALIYIKKHAEEWGGDPNRIFVSGESAGGHLSAMMGATANYAPFQPPEDPLADTSLAGALPIYGVFDFTDENGHLKGIRQTLNDFTVGVRGFFGRVVAQMPYTEETKLVFAEASPTHFLRQALAGVGNSQICPYFVSHGTLDKLAAYGDARQFYDELQLVRQKYGTWTPGESDVFVEVPAGLHGYGYFPSPRSHALADSSSDFIWHHFTRLGNKAAQQ